MINAFFSRHRPAIWLFICGLLGYLFLVTFRYLRFSYNDWDMAYENQIVWYFLKGRFYSSIYDIHPLSGHFEIISFFIAPLLAVFTYPLTYTFVQIFLFIASAWLLYLVSREELGELPALLIGFTYLIFPPNLIAMIHDCNCESLAPVFLMLIFFFFKKKRIIPFYICAAIFLLIKENMALILFMFSLWGLLSKDRNKWTWGVIPLIISVSFFLIAVKLVAFFRASPDQPFWVSFFTPAPDHPIWVRYQYLGASKEEIFSNLLLPQTWFKILLHPWNIQYILGTFGILFCFALLSPGPLLLVLPIFIYHLLSASYPEKTIFYNYALTVTPYIFLSTVQTLKKYCTRRVTLYACCFFIIMGSFLQLNYYWKNFAYKLGLYTQDNYAMKWAMVNSIPKDASVIATFEFLPALSLRDHLYSFHKVYTREYQDPDYIRESIFYTGKTFQVPSHVEYALINFVDPWLRDALRKDHQYSSDKVHAFLKDWVEVSSSGTVKLFKRKVVPTNPGASLN